MRTVLVHNEPRPRAGYLFKVPVCIIVALLRSAVQRVRLVSLDTELPDAVKPRYYVPHCVQLQQELFEKLLLKLDASVVDRADSLCVPPG